MSKVYGGEKDQGRIQEFGRFAEGSHDVADP